MKTDGASLIYTSPSSPNSIPSLIHSILGIHSLLKRQPLKHNVIDREKALIPPNWDSWGKIRVLREGFDVEAVSHGWISDIQLPRHANSNSKGDDSNGDDVFQTRIDNEVEERQGSLSIYEETVQDPKKYSISKHSKESMHRLEVETVGNQSFLASQLETIERLKADEEQVLEAKGSKRNTPTRSTVRNNDDGNSVETRGRVNEHIGPVQFNVGGIQVDADDILKRLKDRDRERTPEREQDTSTPDKSQNEALANFFAGLMKRGGSNSPRTPAT